VIGREQWITRFASCTGCPVSPEWLARSARDLADRGQSGSTPSSDRMMGRPLHGLLGLGRRGPTLGRLLDETGQARVVPAAGSNGTRLGGSTMSDKSRCLQPRQNWAHILRLCRGRDDRPQIGCGTGAVTVSPVAMVNGASRQDGYDLTKRLPTGGATVLAATPTCRYMPRIFRLEQRVVETRPALVRTWEV
jgi:hypothetical protein